ncbi:MAG TPA: histone deacetylase [Thermoanaerobaculia bacterium]|nr:histone deacetylase [Thermoanaerobaculia bacterium]
MIPAMIQVFTDPRCLEHQSPPGYPERPERLAGIVSHLRSRGWPVTDAGTSPEIREAARAAVLAVHEEAYVERFQRAVERGDSLIDSADNPLSDRTWEASWAAVEVALAAADRAAGSAGSGSGDVTFAAVRPPGHHAERSTAMGFCFFNNVAVAAEHLRRRHGASRVAIFDFDVHHGNGTQHLFEEHADIFYVSTHQFPFYPGTGAAGETGRGPGEGATLNCPLPAGTGDEGYEETIRGTVLPGLRRFAPDVLLISAGFDAWQDDPLGGMRVTEEGFRRWGEWLRELAEEVCGGRLMAILEGGYDLRALPRLVEAHLEGMSGGTGARSNIEEGR